MMTIAAARKMILAMPEAEESQHHRHPDFRVNNKVFATLWPAENRVVLKLDRMEQGRLLKTMPAAFSTNAWSKHGWTNVHLQHTEGRLFQQLVEDSWSMVAPKKLVANRGGP